jgi:preprotein translocase subunit SecY
MKPDPNDRWKIRRTLTIGAVVLGTLMIIAGGTGLFFDKFSGELVYGGVTIISAVLAAYQTMATYDDKWQNGGNPDG